MIIFAQPIKKRGHYANLKGETARTGNVTPIHLQPDLSNQSGFLLPKEMSNNTQHHALMELWREVIAMAIRDEDYDALRAMPVDLFILLGMHEPAVSMEVENGYLLADGCKRSFNPTELDEHDAMINYNG